MLKTITKIGNSHGIIFDAALMDLARLKPGDQVNVTVHQGGAIILNPIRNEPEPEAVRRTIQKTVKDYRNTLKRLA